MGMSLRHHCITGVALAAAGFALTGPALAQKSGGILKLYSSDNPPSASILEESTIVPLMPYMRSEEHTSELQSLMRISYAVFCLKKNKKTINKTDKITEYT